MRNGNQNRTQGRKEKPPVTRFAKDNITSLKAAGKNMLEQLLLPEEHLIDRMRVK